MTNQGRQQIPAWWVLWAAFQSGIFLFYHFLGSTAAPSSSPSANSPFWLAAFAPVFVSMVIRWGALPLIRHAQLAFPLFIAGIAMAEATCFLGIFIFPAHKQELFIASALGIFQFIPIFARRFFD